MPTENLPFFIVQNNPQIHQNLWSSQLQNLCCKNGFGCGQKCCSNVQCESCIIWLSQVPWFETCTWIVINQNHQSSSMYCKERNEIENPFFFYWKGNQPLILKVKIENPFWNFLKQNKIQPNISLSFYGHSSLNNEKNKTSRKGRENKEKKEKKRKDEKKS